MTTLPEEDHPPLGAAPAAGAPAPPQRVERPDGHVHRALREVYGEGSGRTIAKLLVLAASYFVLLGATLVGTAVWSALAA